MPEVTWLLAEWTVIVQVVCSSSLPVYSPKDPHTTVCQAVATVGLSSVNFGEVVICPFVKYVQVEIYFQGKSSPL